MRRPNSGCQDLLWGARRDFWGARVSLWGIKAQFGMPGLALGCQDQIWGAGFWLWGAKAKFRMSGLTLGCQGDFWGALNPGPAASPGRAALAPPAPAPDAHAPLPRLRRTPRPQNGGGRRAPPSPHGSPVPGPRRALSPEPQPLQDPRAQPPGGHGAARPRPRAARGDPQGTSCGNAKPQRSELPKHFRDVAQACEHRCILCTFWSWVGSGVGFPHSLCAVITVVL